VSVDPGSRYRPLKFPQNPSRLPVLADWYALIRRKVERQPWPDDLARVIREGIVRIGGEEAIHELQRLQREQAFPDAEWLSHTIIRIEDQMLGMPEAVMPPGQLLDFINRESMGAVLTERDIFEWVCQAIEDVKEGIEKRGEQVKGYWNVSDESWQPKEEPDCQNVLWPAIRARLSNLGIVNIEENWIGASRVDLWVEKPVPDGKSLRVMVELKTARKGYGRSKLIEPIETQLWNKYLQPADCRYGIYVVLWFKDDERYRYPTVWKTEEAFEKELNDRREEVARDNRLSLKAYVIDMTTLSRAH